MKFILLATSMLLGAAPLFASWQRVKDIIRIGATPDEVSEVLAEGAYRSENIRSSLLGVVARQAAGLKSETIVNVDVRYEIFKWSGDNSTCDALDPRQYSETDTGQIVYSDGRSESWFSGPPSSKDVSWNPCEE